jgi:hypothetical protein
VPPIPPTALDRCRALIRRGPGAALVFGLALGVFTAQLLLQMHATKHELLPGVHQVCEQCVTAEHSAPPPALAVIPVATAFALAPDRIGSSAPASRAPWVERSRGPPATLS